MSNRLCASASASVTVCMWVWLRIHHSTAKPQVSSTAVSSFS